MIFWGAGSNSVREAPSEDDEVVLPPPEAAPPLDVEQLRPGEDRWVVTRDLATDTSLIDVVNDRGHVRIPDIGMETWNRADERYEVTGDDVTSARGEVRWTRGFRRDE